MKSRNSLHWSFDYNYGAQTPQFAQELIGTLRGYDPDAETHGTQSPQTLTHVYNVLPNYWRGYHSPPGNAETLRIGTASIERRKNGKLWHYGVAYENTTSGENLHLQFRCGDEDHRPLQGHWRGHTRNSAGDVYSELTWTGYLTSDAEMRLRVNDTEMTAGTVDTAALLTCNWALFDVIPALARTIQASDDGIDIVVLEDLEHLRQKSKIGYLTSVQTPLPLDGYYLYGAGLLPSYWWLNAHGDIAIASTFFETLVLKEKTETRG